MVSKTLSSHTKPDYKNLFPDTSYYNFPDYSIKEKSESPCQSLFWRKIPIKINWIKVFDTIKNENEAQDHDEKPEDIEEEEVEE